MNKKTQAIFDAAHDYADQQHPGGKDIDRVGECHPYCDCLNSKWTEAYHLYHKFPKETDLLLTEVL